MANPICYGDTVFIELDETLLFSNGFFDPKVHFVSKENISLKAFRFGLFRLYPNLSYKDVSQVDHLKDQLDLLKSLNPGAEVAFNELENDLKKEEISLEERDAKLDLLNDKIMKETLGRPIKYGQKIQLFHIESQSFLAPSKVPNEEDNAITNLEMIPVGNKDVYFRFAPALGIIQEGEVVEYNIPLQVVCIKTETPMIKGEQLDLTRFDKELNSAANRLTNNPEEFAVIEPRRKQPLFQQEKVFFTGVKAVDIPQNTYVRKYLTFQEHSELRKKKAFTNGDYVRICNDKVYLTIYPERNSELICFQAYGENEEQSYSSIYTLFQIIEAPEEEQVNKVRKDKIQKFSSTHLPSGVLLEYQENKKYILKHFVSGKILGCDKGVLKLDSHDDANEAIDKISVIMKNKTKDTSATRYIDRNSIMQLRFFGHAGENQGILGIGKGIKTPTSQEYLDTPWFFGPKMTDDYLNKSLMTERFLPKIRPAVDDKSSSFKFTKISADENTSILLVESLANRMAKFLDFLHNFLTQEDARLKDLVIHVRRLLGDLSRFEKQMYQEAYNEAEKDVLTPNKMVQTLLREFRVFDMFYRVFFCLIKDDAFFKKVLALKEASNTALGRAPTMVQFGRRSLTSFEDPDSYKELNFDALMKLLGMMKKIMSVACKRNTLNRTYCCQFVRVLINCMLYSDKALFSLASFKVRMEMKELLLAICKKGLWDEDLDALGQLNNYQSALFESIKNQETFHTIYLRLLEHVAISKAPNLDNTVTENFAQEFLRQPENLEHVFPRLVQGEYGSIYVIFTRRMNPQSSFKIDIEKLDERLLNSPIKDTFEADVTRSATEYLIRSLDLMNALARIDDSTWNLTIVRYYNYDILTKTINVLKNSAYHREIRRRMGEIINSVHQKFFGLPFFKLPKKLQILGQDPVMMRVLSDTKSFITKAVDTSLSLSEIAYMRSQGLMGIINPLKTVITSDDVSEVLRLIESNVSIENNVEEARVILEEIQKVLDNAIEIDLEFLRAAQKIVLRLIKDAAAQKKKTYFDFIDQALEVFSEIEQKIVGYAATDIVGSLKSSRLLNRGHSYYDAAPNINIAEEEQDLSPLAPNSRRAAKKQVTRLEMGLIAKDGAASPGVANALGELYQDWKSGQKTLGDEVPGVTIDKIGKTYKESEAGEVVNVLLDISLLNDDQLLSGVIGQLKRIASYESMLYTELNKLSIVHDPITMTRTQDIIKATFRLNQINREIFFCQHNQLTIEDLQMKPLLREVLDHLCKIFFTIYDASKHFRYPESRSDSSERFKKAFMNTKHLKNDYYFVINSKAINRPFQRIFNIVQAYKTLLRTLEWLLEINHNLEEKTYAIRLIVITLTVFVSENTENQNLFSTMNEFIKLFYQQSFYSQSVDTYLLFAEMMNNKRLQKLPLKYLYDIIVANFMPTVSRSISNSETNSELAAAIISYGYLSKCKISEVIFSSFNTLRAKWEQLSRVDDFTYLNVMGYQGDLILLPHCYFSIKETMEATSHVAEAFEEDFDDSTDLKVILNFPTWLSFFQSRNYLLQYELKNLITQCISKIYYTFGKKGQFVHKFDDCASIVSALIAEILYFRKYTDRRGNQQSVKLKQLLDTHSFVTAHEQYNIVNALYNSIDQQISLETKRLHINLEDISVYDLFVEYIWGGCIDLLFDLALSEVDYFTELVDSRPDRRTLMDFVLLLFDELIESEGVKENFPYQKFEKFLNEASVTKGYGQYKNKIISLTTKIDSRGAKVYQVQRVIMNLTGKNTEMTPLEAFEKHLETLKLSKSALKEQNILDIAEHIQKHPDPNAIIKQIITYLKKDQSKMNVEEIKFILKLLRKFIECENPASLNEPIYKWKNVNISCLKKINKIQRTYKELGLTETLYSLLYTEDPKIYRETILLSLAYMYGGNSEVQQEFFDNFTDDEENEVIDGLSTKLSKAWTIFRAKETERMNYLYGKVQKNIFDALKTKNSINEISDKQLLMSAFENNIDPKYLEYAENDPVNKFFILTLAFLQSLCEKQFTSMQLFLKEQSFNGRVYPKSFDFIGFLRQCINGYHKVLNRYNLTIGNKILDLITELIQGDVTSNISALLNKTFIYDMCRIVTDYNTRYHTLPRGFGLNQFYPSFREIKGQVIFIFKIMLENRNEENLAVMAGHLDTVGLMKTFEQLMINFMNKKNLSIYVTDPNKFVLDLSNEDFKDTLGDAINIYIIYRYLWDDPSDFNDKMRDLIDQMDKDTQDLLGRLVFTVFRRLASSIEILLESKNESLLRVWFPVIAVCNYLSADTQKNFLNNVERDNSQTKLSALVNAVQEFTPQMYTDYKSRGRLFGLNFRNFYYICRFLTNTLALLITIINVGTYQLTPDGSDVEQDNGFDITADVFSYLQIILAFILVAMWLLFFKDRHQSLVWERYVEKNIKELGPLPPTVESKIDDGKFEKLDEADCELILKLKGANSDEFKDMMSHPASRSKIESQYQRLDLWFGIKSKTLIWHVIYFVITVGAIFHPIVAVFEIFDIAIRSDTIKQISGAVSKNARQFMWTLFLLVLTTVIYSSVGFFFLNDSFKNGDDKLCQTAFSCFMNVMNLGLRAGGGIADVIGPHPYEGHDVGFFVIRALFDLSFFIIMITLLMNLIFGMIIDAFGDLRDQKTSNDEDESNVCFICGIERSEFERHANFEDHLNDEHNIWAYINYCVYLKDRQETSKVEMTDIENLVFEKCQQKDFDWFPVGKALTLERIFQKEKVTTENENEKLMKKLESVQKSVNDNVNWVKTKVEQIHSLISKK